MRKLLSFLALMLMAFPSLAQTMISGGVYEQDSISPIEGAEITFSGYGFEGDTPENFRKALEEALTIQGPSWIRCPIDPDEFVLPMIPAGKTVEDIVVSEEDLY